jgi:sulfur carrier protein ThiS
MTILVEVIAPFEIQGARASGQVELPEGTRVRDLLAKYARAPFYARWIPVSVNGVQVTHAHLLADGDRVIFILPRVGG